MHDSEMIISEKYHYLGKYPNIKQRKQCMEFVLFSKNRGEKKENRI